MICIIIDNRMVATRKKWVKIIGRSYSICNICCGLISNVQQIFRCRPGPWLKGAGHWGCDLHSCILNLAPASSLCFLDTMMWPALLLSPHCFSLEADPPWLGTVKLWPQINHFFLKRVAGVEYFVPLTQKLV